MMDRITHGLQPGQRWKNKGKVLATINNEALILINDGLTVVNRWNGEKKRRLSLKAIPAKWIQELHGYDYKRVRRLVGDDDLIASLRLTGVTYRNFNKLRNVVHDAVALQLISPVHGLALTTALEEVANLARSGAKRKRKIKLDPMPSPRAQLDGRLRQRRDGGDN